ncbi:MAG: putative toxin-antitoxin system toxin component, PIN family [Oscillospiraceae bacterium]|nr:putative toxin-antitoxin system toxin component, PIN family [Oscillospiraceae bacterium]
MKILIDTNILISAALNPNGTPFKAYIKAVSYPNKGIICEQNIDELRRIFNRKFPSKMQALDEFLALSLSALEIVPIPENEIEIENKIRDVMDRPILRAALNAKVDAILTGDKDFLESGIEYPQILTASDFLNM